MVRQYVGFEKDVDYYKFKNILCYGSAELQFWEVPQHYRHLKTSYVMVRHLWR